MNRICINFHNMPFIPCNDEPYALNTSAPKKIGEIAMMRISPKFPGPLVSEKEVILLQSKGHVKDSLFLVDLKNKECWPSKESK